MTMMLKTCRIILTFVVSIGAALAINWLLTGTRPVAHPMSMLPIALATVLGGIAWRAAGRNTSSQTEVVPAHFHSALEGLHEAVIILDYTGRVVFSNSSFLEMCGAIPGELLGQRARDLDWKWSDAGIGIDEASSPVIPWLDAVKEGRQRCGRFISLDHSETGNSSNKRIFVMNSVAIAAASERPRGALISFEDVTKLQKKQVELAQMLESIRLSSRQIRQQNEDLEYLVVRDQLTGCFHRRYGLEFLEKFCADAQRGGNELACLLLDIDHFRIINEEHGHLVADKILQEVGTCLLRNVRERDLVCRYDGEEFLIVLPQTTLDDAWRIAETLRHQIARLQIGDATLTVSVGVGTSSLNVASLPSLLTQAESGLAHAKERGRNQVSQPPADDDQTSVRTSPLRVLSDVSGIIPYPAVTALISALAYRDIATAAHSRRVADLCVAMGQRLMSSSSCYVLEMSALLHDIGKVGVPDALLHKVTPLTEAEWNVMRAHERIGVEIIRTSFATPELTEIVENYTQPYADSIHQSQTLPLGARILAVADAYDSMVTEQIYRNAMTSSEALAELQRCSGTQFDPEIVAHFSELVNLHGHEAVPRIGVDAESALAFGMELERLAEAVDQQDMDVLTALAGHLCHTANKSGAHEISAKAMELEQAARSGTDQLGVLQCANELLNYCRATQRAYMAPTLQTF